MKIAIIDIGTNTTLLLVAEVSGDSSFKILHDECRITRLGEGLNSPNLTNPQFLPQPMKRCLNALRDYKKTLEKFHCDDCHVVGTAAFRQANNANDFVERVKNELGLTIKIISGEEEAQLIHLACSRDFPNIEKPILVLDIGGGSTEFIFDDGKNIREISLPFGVVKLTEQFLFSDPPTENEMKNLEDFLKKEIAQKVKPLISTQKPSVIATAGTPTALKALALHLDKYDASQVHGKSLTRSEVEKIFVKLKNLPFAKRAQLPCLPEKRADVILAGTAILMTVLDGLQLEKFWVSDRGLRFGILYKQI